MNINWWRLYKIFWSTFFSLVLLGVIFAVFFAHVNLTLNWRTANRESAKIAPLPNEYKDAVVQVYAARAYGWRGLFAVHTWIAIKDKDARKYKVYQVLGWRSFFGQLPLSIQEDIPDRMWFGQKPDILQDIRGVMAEKIINKIDHVARSYPWQRHYVLWPGPNSNTFTAYMARKIPELHFVMPPIAVGKDYLGLWRIYAKAPSCTGYQISLYGIFGILLAKEEGLEINIFGLIFGFNFKKPALVLPGIGYLKINH